MPGMATTTPKKLSDIKEDHAFRDLPGRQLIRSGNAT